MIALDFCPAQVAAVCGCCGRHVSSLQIQRRYLPTASNLRTLNASASFTCFRLYQYYAQAADESSDVKGNKPRHVRAEDRKRRSSGEAFLGERKAFFRNCHLANLTGNHLRALFPKLANVQIFQSVRVPSPRRGSDRNLRDMLIIIRIYAFEWCIYAHDFRNEISQDGILSGKENLFKKKLHVFFVNVDFKLDGF